MTNPQPALDIAFDNSYALLPPEFYQRLEPTPVSAPSLIRLNQSLCDSLGLNAERLASDIGIAMLAGNHVPEGAEPLAMAYAGHQFGNWVPQLGDGRAILLGELLDTQGVRQDIQLKGAGRTAWSRGGDGRNWLGPVLREYIVSEAMAALSVPTTRALAAVATGEAIYRETGAMPGAVLVRTAPSHIRVGTFQYFIARNNIEALEALVDHVIARHYPKAADADRPALALLDAVIEAQASLIAHWQSIGFIHGVMNTDNSSVAGITIDYGPCAFMDAFHPEQVFSSIDVGGRYAYQNQPQIAQWNMANLAQCLLPLIDDDKDKSVELAQASVNRFPELYQKHYTRRFSDKLGLTDSEDEDLELIADLLQLMEGVDFTIGFRALSTDLDAFRALFSKADTDNIDTTNVGSVQVESVEVDVTHVDTAKMNSAQSHNAEANAKLKVINQWLLRWSTRIERSGRPMAQSQLAMQQTNPAIIPRNHQIEAVIRAAIDDGDFKPFERLTEALAKPFDKHEGPEQLALAPLDAERITQTFCGT